jgi:putative tryptophan/tyrosine transport system substrate-binding protein
MRRREFIVSSLVLANWPEVAAAQSPRRAVRIGWIVATSASASAPFLDALRTGLADLGYAEGRNLTIETRYADDVPGRVPVLIEELLRIPVDVMVTQGPTTWEVVKNVTTVPVVYVFSADPVEAGFAQSFARPQGNSTGLTLMSVGIALLIRNVREQCQQSECNQRRACSSHFPRTSAGIPNDRL